MNKGTKGFILGFILGCLFVALIFLIYTVSYLIDISNIK